MRVLYSGTSRKVRGFLLGITLILCVIRSEAVASGLADFEVQIDPAKAFGRSVSVSLTSAVAFSGERALVVDGRRSGWDGCELKLGELLKGLEGGKVEVGLYVRHEAEAPRLVTLLLKTSEAGREKYEVLLEKVVIPGAWKELKTFIDLPGGFPPDYSIVVTLPNDPSSQFFVDSLYVRPAQEGESIGVVYKTSFETGTDGWQPRGNVRITLSDRRAQRGSKSLFISDRQMNWQGAQIDLKNIVKPGGVYIFEGWVFQETGANEQIIMTVQRRYSTDGATRYEWVNAQSVPSGTWVKLYGTYSIPSNVSVDEFILYFEASNPNVSFYVDEVSIADVATPKLTPDFDAPPLKKAFDGAFKVGVAIPFKVLQNEIESRLVAKHFNSITAENEMKPESLLVGVERGKLKFDFRQADEYIRFAEQNGIAVRGHTLVWHSQTPDWFFRDEKGNLLSKEALIERLREYVHAVVGHFKGKVYAWDVVNEAVDPSQPDGYRRSLWYQIVGPEYIELAFKFAHEADPEAKLFYNDYNTFDPRKRAFIHKIVRELKEKGVPIHGVGIQGHVSLATNVIEEFEKAILLFTSVPGIEIHVTELDISIYRDQGSRLTLPSRELLIEQAHKYREIFGILRKFSGVVTNVTFWGLKDDYSWLNSNRSDWPLLFDRDYQTKLAYWALIAPDQIPVMPKVGCAAHGRASIFGLKDESYMLAKPIQIVYNQNELLRAWVLWDKDTIFIYGEVTDHTKYPEEDGVEVYLNISGSRGPTVGTSVFTATVLREGTVRLNDPNVRLRRVFRPTSNGYVFELAWRLPRASLRAGDTVGFDIVLRNDGRRYSWSDVTNQQAFSTMNYGSLKLESPKLVRARYGTPVIDAEVDDLWEVAEEIQTRTIVLGTQKNARAKVRVLWDENALYLLFIVQDELLNRSNPNPWEQDSVEVFIDENNAKTKYYEDDDAQYRVNYENLRTFGAGAIAEFVRSATKLIPRGYIVEMAIKWKSGSPAPNSVVGFDVQVNDADANGRRTGVSTWSDPFGNNWRDTSEFGNLKLLK